MVVVVVVVVGTKQALTKLQLNITHIIMNNLQLLYTMMAYCLVTYCGLTAVVKRGWHDRISSCHLNLCHRCCHLLSDYDFSQNKGCCKINVSSLHRFLYAC